jgi:predicted ester cyclase
VTETSEQSGRKMQNEEAPHGASSAAHPKRTMPTDFSISIKARRGENLTAAELGKRRQPMRGYEDTYTDIIDYIVRVTDRIWEDQDVGYIYDTYRAGCRVYDDNGPKYGVERVVEETIQAIHAFPDTRHYADDIIWAGNEDEGFATSHRAINVGHHLGPWRWGPPSGHKIQLWVIANCVSQENEIFEEWVLYNTAARLAQCGVDLPAAARTYGNQGLSFPLGERELTEVERLRSGRKPDHYPVSTIGHGFDVEHAIRALFHEVYNRRDFSAIDLLYAPNVRWHGTSNREGYGRADVRAMARGLLATFPDLGLQVDEVYWMGNETDGFSATVRWTAIGTHRGYALYGPPTGRRVHLWGISQLYFSGGLIVEDWMLFNEFDVMAQLLRDEMLPLLPSRA